MPRIIYSGQPAGFEAVRDGLAGVATVESVPETAEAIRAALPLADGYFATLKVRLDAGMIAAAPSLRVVASPTTGSDHVDLAALADRGIPFICLKGERDFLNSITPTSELAFLHVLAQARRLRDALAQPLAGEWDSQRVAGLTLNGRTLGVIGVGRLGTWMGRYGRSFGMRVLGTDPQPLSWPPEIEPASLDEVLSQSDFVSIHVHLFDATRGLIGARELALMKPTAVLINTSRGPIVDESAVIAALEHKRFAGYSCDVLDGELDRPIASHPLVDYARTHTNVIITPHIGGVSLDAVRRTAAFVAGKVRPLLERA